MAETQSTMAVAAAIVAQAAQDGLGNTPPWDEVQAGLLRLRDDPSGPEHLRRATAGLNDNDAIGIIRSWCERLLEDDEVAARGISRASTTLLQPGQAALFALSVGSTLALWTGALPVLPGGLLFASAIFAAAGATFGRWILSGKEDTRRRDADRTRRLLGVLNSK